MTDETVTGGCLCGAIRYEVSAPPGEAMTCHCSKCQRLSGSAFLVGAFYSREHFQLTQGEPRWHESSPIADRGFCGVCGSQMFTRLTAPGYSEMIGLSVGSHDNPNSVSVVGHMGVESQQAWLKLDDDLPRHEYLDSFVEDVIAGDGDTFTDAYVDTILKTEK